MQFPRFKKAIVIFFNRVDAIVGLCTVAARGIHFIILVHQSGGRARPKWHSDVLQTNLCVNYSPRNVCGISNYWYDWVAKKKSVRARRVSFAFFSVFGSMPMPNLWPICRRVSVDNDVGSIKALCGRTPPKKPYQPFINVCREAIDLFRCGDTFLFDRAVRPSVCLHAVKFMVHVAPKYA